MIGRQRQDILMKNKQMRVFYNVKKTWVTFRQHALQSKE